jgi:hypothetical protein
MLTQLTRYASVHDVPLESAEMSLRATFPLEGKYGGNPDVGVAMERLTYTLEIQSDAPRERVVGIVEMAERFCHAANSLRVPVPVDGTLRLNGADVPFAPPEPPELRR